MRQETLELIRIKKSKQRQNEQQIKRKKQEIESLEEENHQLSRAVKNLCDHTYPDGKSSWTNGHYAHDFCVVCLVSD